MQEINVSTHTRVIISIKRMNEENISIYEVGTKGGSIGRKCVPINVNQVTYDNHNLLIDTNW